MEDLTQGSIARQLASLSVPICAGMVFQALYFLVDLYFVAHIGEAAIAGVSAAGTIIFVVLALTQVLGTGTVTLTSHAAGRQDRAMANLVFNQSILLATCCSMLTLIAGYLTTASYMRAVAADPAAAIAGAAYLYWYLPGLALQFALVSMGSALRATGIVRPAMTTQILTVLLNVILAPLLIAGWGTHHPLGVAGAGLATTISLAFGVVLMWIYFARLEKYVIFDPKLWRAHPEIIKRLLNVGLPAGGEFLLMFAILTVMYWAIRGFGPAAQAGFGIGARVTQALFLPPMAISFSASAIAGQNFGAGKMGRVKETFRTAAILSSIYMLGATLLCQSRPHVLAGAFTHDVSVTAICTEYLRIISWNFPAAGLIFVCSSLFQALGYTWPSLLSSGSRLITFVLPVIWLSKGRHFELRQLWILSVATIAAQAVISLVLLQGQFRRRLVAVANTHSLRAPPEAARSAD
ncbi:MAG TPA: MATE family efflux transporter, partial [Steroidobacteraceae bacterium]